MKNFFWVLMVSLFLLSLPVKAEIISNQEKELYAAYFFVNQAPPTTLGYILTNFGPGNINFLERIDIVLDEERRVAGVLLVYTPPDGFRRHVFLPHPKGWMFQEVRPGAKGKKIFIRVVTTDELNKVD